MKTTVMFFVLAAVLLLPGGPWLESADAKPLKQFETLVGVAFVPVAFVPVPFFL